MTMLTARYVRRGWRRTRRRGYVVPILIACVVGSGAVAAVGYLLWPTWTQTASNNPDRIPVSIGGTLFNVSAASFRIKVQKHSGPQDRVDLSFDYPSLEAPSTPRPVSVETIDENAQAIDRIFLTIAAHNDALSPDQRARTIYPRYFDNTPPTPPQDGLSSRAFRDNSPYSGDDVFFANNPVLIARCTREGDTPGMCLSERRIEGTDLTFRFPRAWLTQDWRNVATAMDRLTMQLRGTRG